MVVSHGFAGLPCGRSCRGLVMAGLSSAWPKVLREAKAVTRCALTWPLTPLAFTRRAATYAIPQRQRRARSCQCKSDWPDIGQFEFRLELIPKGFKLIAVGERRATPTESPTKRFLTLKGSNCDA